MVPNDGDDSLPALVTHRPAHGGCPVRLDLTSVYANEGASPTHCSTLPSTSNEHILCMIGLNYQQHPTPVYCIPR